MHANLLRTLSALLFLSTAIPGSLRAQTWNRGAYGLGWNSAVIHAISATDPLDVVVGGSFTAAPGVTTSNVARWNGVNWVALGAGIPNQVLHLARRPNGNVVAVDSAQQVREWDGFAWTNLGAPGTPGATRDVRVLANGTVAVALAVNVVGSSGLWLSQGGAWAPFGAPGTPAEIVDVVHAVQEPTPGNLVVAGNFSLPAVTGTARVNLASWDGVQWTVLEMAGATARSFDEFRVFRNGDFVVATHSPGNARTVQRRNAGTWKVLAKPDNAVAQLEELPNGDILIVGDFGSVDGVATTGVARVSGILPLPFATLNQAAHCAAYLADGTVVLGGAFTTVGGLAASNFEGFGPAIAPRIANLGGGCSGSTLTATNLPFVGATFTAVATNLPAGFAIEVWGAAPLSPTLPLGPLFGGPANGCDLGVTPILLQAYAPIGGGSLDVAFTIANDPSFLGAGWFQQVFAVGAGGVAIATNVQLVRLGGF